MVEEYYSVKEVAAKLHVSERTVWRWVYARRIPVFKLEGCVRIKESELRKLLAAYQVRRLPERMAPVLKRVMKSRLSD